MERLGKKQGNLYNTIEAYACMCATATCSCGCNCVCFCSDPNTVGETIKADSRNTQANYNANSVGRMSENGR